VKMARPPPAGAISARARPIILSGLWRSRQVLSPTSGLLPRRSCSSSLLLFHCRSCSLGRRVLARWERNSRFRVEFVAVVFLPGGRGIRDFASNLWPSYSYLANCGWRPVVLALLAEQEREGSSHELLFLHSVSGRRVLDPQLLLASGVLCTCSVRKKGGQFAVN
jgi:hypothetical protein